MIGAARIALHGILEGAGIRTSATVPERITPPLAVLEPSSDWVQSGDVYGSFRVGFDVTLIVQTAANATVSNNLDDLVDDAIEAIADANGFYVGSVGAPSLLSVQNAEFLTASMTVYQNTTL
jgi:hypothetical protein